MVRKNVKKKINKNINLSGNILKLNVKSKNLTKQWIGTWQSTQNRSKHAKQLKRRKFNYVN